MDALRGRIVVKCKVACHARKVLMHFAVQAPGFVKVIRLRHSYIGICSFRVVFSCFVEVLNPAVTLGVAVARLLRKPKDLFL